MQRIKHARTKQALQASTEEVYKPHSEKVRNQACRDKTNLASKQARKRASEEACKKASKLQSTNRQIRIRGIYQSMVNHDHSKPTEQANTQGSHLTRELLLSKQLEKQASRQHGRQVKYYSTFVTL